jgi:hypothetical protein
MLRLLAALLPIVASALGYGFAQADDRGEQPRRLALVITVERYYTTGLRVLDNADRDGTRLSAALRAEGFDVELLNTIPAKRDQTRLATLVNARRHLRARAADCRRGDIFILVLIGLGLQGPSAESQFFCLRDSEADQFDSMLPLAEVFNLLNECPATNKMVLLDVSRQAPARRGSGRPLDEVRVPVRGIGVLVGSRPLEFGIESAERESGLFAYRVAEGLAGDAADAAGRVTWDGLSRYVRSRVPNDAWRGSDRTSSSQHPLELAAPIDPNVVLAVTSVRPAAGQVGPDKLGKQGDAGPGLANGDRSVAAPPDVPIDRIPRFLPPAVEESDRPDTAAGSAILVLIGSVTAAALFILALGVLITAWANRCTVPRAMLLAIRSPVDAVVAIGRHLAGLFTRPARQDETGTCSQ